MPFRFTKQSTSKATAVKRASHTSSLATIISLVVAGLFMLSAGIAAGTFIAQKKPTFLLVQQADTGSLRPSNTDSGTYLLTMSGIKPHTLIFSDRPNRTVGSWTMTDFISRWESGADSFADDPPNAVLLSHSQADGKEYAITLELNNPVFNGPGGWVSYTATILSETNPDDLAISSDRHMEDFPDILHNPALFIDDVINPTHGDMRGPKPGDGRPGGRPEMP